ncbi:hypothetical protein D0T84_12350 [Dysgonomonas sp. 521]|uniref:FISUMP domain-containing protein n=1 Tax=Dysgonomonas sp. 521 TaxID=2302932 RepID=UPI0013D592B6|nr:FISUMP domain-containing protein [Dysgonomonas sp. 521]NDV95699.1 hypothetical protein [Dysgonomonas sp. 521]
MKKLLLFTFILCMVTAVCAQVTMGSDKAPEPFSALELISSGENGLRMPLLTTADRNKMTATFGTHKEGLAKGLTIYNTTTNCLEYWNGTKWISTCGGEDSPYTSVTPDGKATVTACASPTDETLGTDGYADGYKIGLRAVEATTGFYMFTYQTMRLYANYSDTPEPTSYQWVVDGKAISGATASTFAYTPPANIALKKDDLGNYKKTVTITCQMTVGGNDIEPVDKFDILVVHVPDEDKDKDGLRDLQPIYVWGHENGVAGADKVKVTFAHVNLGAENDNDPCNCLGDLYQWGRVADGHEKRTSAGYPTNDTSSENGIAANEDLDINGQIAEGNASEGKFIKQKDDPYSWRPVDGMIGLWGDSSTEFSANYNQAKGTVDPCPTGWKVPSQKQWGAIYRGGIASGDPGSATSSSWNYLGRTLIWERWGSTSGYKVAEALYLPLCGYRSHETAQTYLVGHYGAYWCSTVLSNNAYYLHLDGGSIIVPGGNRPRAYGFSVRCVPE